MNSEDSEEEKTKNPWWHKECLWHARCMECLLYKGPITMVMISIWPGSLTWHQERRSSLNKDEDFDRCVFNDGGTQCPLQLMMQQLKMTIKVTIVSLWNVLCPRRRLLLSTIWNLQTSLLQSFWPAAKTILVNGNSQRILVQSENCNRDDGRFLSTVGLESDDVTSIAFFAIQDQPSQQLSSTPANACSI